jgi:hypothetical protein
MSLYPVTIRRCQHIKVNGTQCGSPAIRDEQHCYYHLRWQSTKMAVILKKREHWIAGLPILEDANSIQVGLAEVMRLLVTQEIDHKTGALLLYAMQTASANLRMTSFEPRPTRMVIDRECVVERPIGATAWSNIAGREYDELTEDELTQDGRATNGRAKSTRKHDDLGPVETPKDKETRETNERWRATYKETPEDERLRPGESQRDRYIRVQKQKGLPIDPARV